MKLLSFIITCFILSFANTILAQTGLVMGVVQDATSNQPVEFATISIHQQSDSTLITGGITDEKGNYKIEKIPFGNYYIQIDFIGYQRSNQTLSLSQQQSNVNLGATLLKMHAETLQTAEITAETSMQLGIDRKIFDVEKSTLNKGGNAIDVLKNTPTLDVDANGNISLRGSQGVNVLINGKPSGMTGANRQAMLKQIPANLIKSIEIITNPSAKFDPDGTSGIINIVLKKNKMQGFSGNVSYNIGTLANKHNATVGLNFRNEKINLFANYNFNHHDTWVKENAKRKTIYGDGTFTFLEDYTTGNEIDQGHFAKIGLDYFINSKNTLSLSASVNPSDSRSIDSIRYTFFDADYQVTNYLKCGADKRGNPFNMVYNLNYATSFKSPEQKLEFDANYAFYSYPAKNNFSQDDFNNPPSLQYNTAENHHNILNIKLDYTHPFKNEGKLEVGAKGSYRLITNDFVFKNYNYNNQTYETNTTLSNNFQFSEQVYAVYGIYGQKIKKFSFQLGLRLEQALVATTLLTTNQTFHNDYFSFFPSGHLNYELPKSQQLQLSYSRRINRPPTQMLNPFADRTDPLTIQVGNPYLKPEYINSFEFTYAKYWKKGSLSSSLYYRYTTNVIRRLFDVDAQGIGSISFTNFAEVHAFGVEVVGNVQLFDWWRMNASINAYQMQEDGTNLDAQYRNSTFTGHANLGSSFELPLDFGIQMNLFYRAPMFLVIGSITDMFHSSFSLSKSFLKKSLNITLSVQDPFGVQSFGYDLASDNYTTEGTRRWESRVAYLSISYDFGKMDMKTKRRMNQGANNTGGGGGGF